MERYFRMDIDLDYHSENSDIVWHIPKINYRRLPTFTDILFHPQRCNEWAPLFLVQG